VRDDELAVTLLQDANRLLLEMPEALARMAAQAMTDRGIDVRLETRAARVDADGVTLEGGEFIAASTVICTIGTKPNPLVERLAVRLSLPTQRGRIETEVDTSVRGIPKYPGQGDCALVRWCATRQRASHPRRLPNMRSRRLDNSRTTCCASWADATHARSRMSQGG
jgi:NADH:ubiquinone reductase (H+-translocating)